MKFLIRLFTILFKRAKLNYFLKTYSSTLYQVAFSILDDKLLAEQAVLDAFSKTIPYLHQLSIIDFDKKVKGFLLIVVKYTALTESSYNKEEDSILYPDTKANIEFPIKSDIKPNITNIKPNTDIPDNIANDFHSKQLLPLLLSLKPIEQDLFLLFYVHRLSLEAAAELLNLPLATAKACFLETKEYLAREFLS